MIPDFISWVGSFFGQGGVIDSVGLTFTLKAIGYEGREPSTFKPPELPTWATPRPDLRRRELFLRPR